MPNRVKYSRELYGDVHRRGARLWRLAKAARAKELWAARRTTQAVTEKRDVSSNDKLQQLLLSATATTSQQSCHSVLRPSRIPRLVRRRLMTNIATALPQATPPLQPDLHADVPSRTDSSCDQFATNATSTIEPSTSPLAAPLPSSSSSPTTAIQPNSEFVPFNTFDTYVFTQYVRFGLLDGIHNSLLDSHISSTSFNAEAAAVRIDKNSLFIDEGKTPHAIALKALSLGLLVKLFTLTAVRYRVVFEVLPKTPSSVIIDNQVVVEGISISSIVDGYSATYYLGGWTKSANIIKLLQTFVTFLYATDYNCFVDFPFDHSNFPRFDLTRQPLSLKQQCRRVIRKSLKDLRSLCTLPLPEALIEFLEFKGFLIDFHDCYVINHKRIVSSSHYCCGFPELIRDYLTYDY